MKLSIEDVNAIFDYLIRLGQRIERDKSSLQRELVKLQEIDKEQRDQIEELDVQLAFFENKREKNDE